MKEYQVIISLIGTTIAIISFIYLLMRNFKKDISERFDKFDLKFDKINEKLENIESRLTYIDSRLSRLEGAFCERGQWEGRLYSMQKTITEERK